jgi:hypothetical protein
MKTEEVKNVSCVFEKYPDDMPPLMIDEKVVPTAYLTSIEEGEHKGVWMFTSKDRAEEFAWKRGLTYRFESTMDFDQMEDSL